MVYLACLPELCLSFRRVNIEIYLFGVNIEEYRADRMFIVGETAQQSGFKRLL
jgi:hypothetical protein